MSVTTYGPSSIVMQNLTTSNTYESCDLISLAASLAPSTSNAAVIQQWIQKTVGQIAVTSGTSPYWSNAVTFNTISGTAGSSAYCGGVLLPDGRVIFSPFNASNVGTFNTFTNTFRSVAGGQPATRTNKYWTSVLIPDGRVVFCPRGEANVGIFNPVTNSFTTVVGTGTLGVTIPPGSDGYIGGTLASDGRVIFAPFNATHVGTYNPATNSFVTYASAGSTPPGAGAYVGAVLVPNGKVIFVPYAASSVGIFDTVTNTFSTVAASTGSTSAYEGGVVVPDGRVVFTPTSATNVGTFDPVTSTFKSYSGPAGLGAYNGAVLLPDGRVLFVSAAATNVGIFDPVTNLFTTIASGGPSASYWGGNLLSDGRVVFCPNNATTIGILQGGVPVSSDLCIHPMFNKF